MQINKLIHSVIGRFVVRYVILCSLLLGVGSAQAMTTPIFKQDGSQATILFAGIPGDTDPSGLYNSLAIAPEDFQGKWAKKLFLADASGAHAFDIDCVFSKMIAYNGTCTMIFRRSPGLIEVDANAGRARLTLTGAAAAKFAALFVVRSDSPQLFRSKDGRFNAAATFDRGEVSELVFDWNGKGL
jgi:hypothetical protein